MGKSKESQFKNYINELKEEISLYSKKNIEKDPNFEKEVAEDLKEEIDEEKKIIKITGGAILILMFLFALFGLIFYLCFHKKIDKTLNNFIDNIPIVDSKKTNSSTNICPDAVGIYTFGSENIKLMSGGLYEKSLNGIRIATGIYNVQNKTIIANVIYVDDSANSPKLTYSISKDCKTLIEVNSGKKYAKK